MVLICNRKEPEEELLPLLVLVLKVEARRSMSNHLAQEEEKMFPKLRVEKMFAVSRRKLRYLQLIAVQIRLLVL
jgi:hypothetical protein